MAGPMNPELASDPVVALARALASRLAKVLPEGFEICARGRALVYGPAGQPDERLELPADVTESGLDRPPALAALIEGVLGQVQDAVMVRRRGPWPEWLQHPGAAPTARIVRDGAYLTYGMAPDCLPLQPIILRLLGWPPLRWDDEEPADPFATEVEQWLADRLVPDGWLVDVQRDNNPAFVRAALEHPLGGTRCHIIEESSGWQQEAEAQLADFAFRCVREHPSDLPHFELLGSLRDAPNAPDRRDREFFCALAWRLHEHDVITYDEYLWLCWAGPAWSRSPPPAETWQEFLEADDWDDD